VLKALAANELRDGKAGELAAVAKVSYSVLRALFKRSGQGPLNDRIMAGQNHTPEGTMTSKSRALERAHSLSSGRLRFMILSGHDSVGSSGLGFCKSGKLGESRFAFVAAIAPRVAPERIVSYAFCRFTHSQSQL